VRRVGAKRHVEANTSELTTKAPEKRSLFDSSVSSIGNRFDGTTASVLRRVSAGVFSIV
jgi:hypothetical protein